MLIRSWTFLNEIQCYLYDRNQALASWAELQKNIPKEELERAQQMKSGERAQTFLLSRALLRGHLAQLSPLSPAEFKILLTPKGKPFLAASDSDAPLGQAPSNVDITFSVSHSEERILLALSPHGWTFGVDLQFIDPLIPSASIAQKLFSDEDELLLRSLQGSQHTNKFFELWCLYEARFKMQGSSDKKSPQEASLVEKIDSKYQLGICYLDEA